MDDEHSEVKSPRDGVDARVPRGRFSSTSVDYRIWMVAVVTATMAYSLLTAPQDKFRPGTPSLPAVVGFVVLAVIFGVLLLAIAWTFDVSMSQVLRWLGFCRPRGVRNWWQLVLVLLGAIAIGVVIRKEIVPLIGDLWPGLKVQTPAQLAADAERDVMMGAPSWMVWAHAAGEEVVFRCVVVAATVWAFGDGPLRWREVQAKRLAGLVAVVLASSVAFAFAHAEFSWYNAAAAGAMGLVCAVLAVVMRSVWPSVVVHAAYNTPAIAMLSRLW
ncbi:hypothetical protein GCM10009551_053770 [Nocardiopsis tropica]|uniref:CPBP family intramembrane glutamic endopeptidase n=1 Tax=Tsukamurella strandjordii TaxID=147577 RepID=UPI0031E2C698